MRFTYRDHRGKELEELAGKEYEPLVSMAVLYDAIAIIRGIVQATMARQVEDIGDGEWGDRDKAYYMSADRLEVVLGRALDEIDLTV